MAQTQGVHAASQPRPDRTAEALRERQQKAARQEAARTAGAGRRRI